MIFTIIQTLHLDCSIETTLCLAPRQVFSKRMTHLGSPKRTNESEPLGVGPGATFLTASLAILMHISIEEVQSLPMPTSLPQHIICLKAKSNYTP